MPHLDTDNYAYPAVQKLYQMCGSIQRAGAHVYQDCDSYSVSHLAIFDYPMLGLTGGEAVSFLPRLMAAMMPQLTNSLPRGEKASEHLTLDTSTRR